MSYDFYKALQYPIPQPKEFFSYTEKEDLSTLDRTGKKSFSRDMECAQMAEYREFINKYQRLRKYIPGVRAIYLCNSITFNALHNNSDIDLFIVTKTNRIWRARLRSMILTTLTGTRRRGKNIRKKFCISFYISERKLNMSSLRLKEGDVYLPYWISHLVPLYHEKDFDTNSIYTANSRTQNYLPNISLKQNIFLKTTVRNDTSLLKKTLDHSRANYIISAINNLIGNLRKPIITRKSKKEKNNIKYIITNNDTLKFHKDKRRQYYFLFKKQRRTQR